jgi:hypothetical protein
MGRGGYYTLLFMLSFHQAHSWLLPITMADGRGNTIVIVIWILLAISLTTFTLRFLFASKHVNNIIVGTERSNKVFTAGLGPCALFD